MGSVLAVDAGLVALLLRDSSVRSLVSNRIYPMVLPQQGTLPAITYQMISHGRTRLARGRGTCPYAVVQLSCWGRQYSVAAQVANTVDLALDGYIGNVVVTTDTLRMLSVFVIGRAPFYDKDDNIHWHTLDVRIMYSEN